MDKLQTLTIDANTHFAFLQSQSLMEEIVLVYQILNGYSKNTAQVRRPENFKAAKSRTGCLLRFKEDKKFQKKTMTEVEKTSNNLKWPISSYTIP